MLRIQRLPSQPLRHSGPLALVAMSVLLSALLWATPAAAYIVVLKDGTQITTTKKYEVQGDLVLLTMPSGVTTSYRSSEVDFERTDELNQGTHLSGAKFIEDRTIKEIEVEQEEPEREVSFSDLVGGRSLARPDDESSSKPTAEEAVDLPLTKAGYVDMMQLERLPYDDPEVADAIIEFLIGQGHEGVRVYGGSGPGKPLVEVRANSESGVFKGLRDSAAALVQIHQQFPDRVVSFDLLILTERDVRAGQFSLTPDQAGELTAGRIEPPAFFLRYVEF